MVPGDRNGRGKINLYPQCLARVCTQRMCAGVNETHSISGVQVGGKKHMAEKPK